VLRGGWLEVRYVNGFLLVCRSWLEWHKGRGGLLSFFLIGLALRHRARRARQ
jgi:hypothetical protein